MTADPQAWALIGLGIVLVALAAFAVRARSLFALGAGVAALSFTLALAMLALDAPDVALIAAFVGAGILAPLFLGAVNLAGKSAAARKPRWAPIGLAALVVALSVWAVIDLPELGARSHTAGTGTGVFYVNRALGESGLANAVMAVSANYRAIDSVLSLCVLLIAALGAYAALGFGERSALRQPPAETTEQGE